MIKKLLASKYWTHYSWHDNDLIAVAAVHRTMSHGQIDKPLPEWQ